MERMMYLSRRGAVIALAASFMLQSVMLASAADSTASKVVDGKFLRRSVTVIGVTTEEAARYLKVLRKGIADYPTSSRFDANLISTEELDSFTKNFQASGFNPLDKDQVQRNARMADVIRTSILASIVKSSCNTDTLQERFRRQQKRDVITALSQQKEISLTQNEMAEITNGSFIGMLLLRSVTKDKDSYKADGTVYFYRLDVGRVGSADWTSVGKDYLPRTMDLVDVVFVYQKDINTYVKDESTSSSTTKTNNLQQKQKKASAAAKTGTDSVTLASDEKSVVDLIDDFFGVAFSMDEFRIRGVVQSASGKPTIDVGKREDVYPDQGYRVYEPRLDANGKQYTKEIGFVRVEEVFDNTSTYGDSRGYTIINKGIEQGNIAVSHDQGPDLRIGLGSHSISIPSGISIVPYDEDVTSSVNINAGVYINAAKLFKSKQTFIGLHVIYGIPTTVSSTPTTQYTLQADLSLMKKIWLSRINIFGELQAGINSLSITGTYNREEWTLSSGLGYGLGLNTGLEYAVSPDVNFALYAGYRLALSSNEVELTYKGKTEAFTDDSVLNMDLGGLRFGLTVSYSLPPFF
jgi:hypothetical protein